MITINTTTDQRIQEIVKQLGLLLDTDRMLRPVAISMVAVLRKRVHEDGLDANGNLIGTYSDAYLKTRLKHNRTADRKKILSLDRQMENDLKAVPTEKGWGIGYSNQFNFDKALWNEIREEKQILTALTTEEEDQAQQIVSDYVDEIIDAIP